MGYHISHGTISRVEELSHGTIPLCTELSHGTILLCTKLSHGTILLCTESSHGTIPLCNELSHGGCCPNWDITAVGIPIWPLRLPGLGVGWIGLQVLINLDRIVRGKYRSINLYSNTPLTTFRSLPGCATNVDYSTSRLGLGEVCRR